MDVEVEKDDLNQKFLTSLAPEWLMHTIVWRNRNDLDTMSLDDLYNHLKVYEAEVQKKSNSNLQNMAFISSSKNNSENEDGNNTCVSTSKFKDINQIDEDNMEEMDIKWSMALLSMRADKFWKRTGKKISIQGSDVAGFDKSKVECFNCHKMGHFARECRAPKSLERGRKERYRQGSKAGEKTPKALMAIDGVGWDWSYMENEREDHALVADGEAPSEFALMANTKSKVFDNSLCLNECRLTEYEEREVKYIEKIRTLEMYRASSLKCIKILDKELEELKLENDVLDGKLAGLLKASKNLDHLIESQRSDQVKEGVGYNAVPPPTADLYLSLKKDLSWTGLPEFVDDTVTDYSRPTPTVTSTSAEGQNKDYSTFEDVASPNSPKPFVKFIKHKDSQTDSETNKQETPKKPQVKFAEQYRHSNKKPKVKRNQRNWNNLKSYQLGPEFVLKKKACYKCGPSHRFAGHRLHGAPMRPPNKSFGHRSHGPSMRPSNRHDGHRPHGPSMNPRRPNMNGARPNRSFFNQASSYETRPFSKSSAVKTQNRAPWVSTVNSNNPPVNRKFSTGRRNIPTGNRKFPISSRKFPTGSTKITLLRWEGREKLSHNNIDDKGYCDSGCSWHMTGNISYLSDFEPFDGGYVSFGQGGCKITGKGTIKTGKLEFENVYFVKDLKYNLFSVSQICDNKNSVLFTDSEASADECILWHKRLGHLNVKTMNKLVRHNLVRGLPTKSFDNDHTCTACLKGKQHKASCKSKTKDETSDILKKFITEIENLKDLKVKIISVLFTDAECIVLGRNFKLLDDANILLRIPRQHNMYSINLKNIVPHKDLTCLVANASDDELKESLAMLGLLSRMVLLKG
nr:hypothetical protein [Tanacetum cinerariifolium]